MLRLLAWTLTMIGAVLMASPTVAAADAKVYIELQGPVARLPVPRPDYSLEVGGQAWTIDRTLGGGSLALEVGGPVVVRLRTLPGCQTVVMFVAQPGSSHIIRLLGHGTFRVEDWTKNGLDLLDGLPAGGTLSCPGLPDTSTAPAGRAPGGGGDAPWALLVGGVGAALAASRRARLRRKRFTQQLQGEALVILGIHDGAVLGWSR